MMPDLPNVGWERDIEAFREFFESPAFRADGLKLYPTLVIRGKTNMAHAVAARGWAGHPVTCKLRGIIIRHAAAASS